ncbi:hypothetical protein D5086_012687 [Populus alba]|uniref:Uncharacterized protein n=1 Tax=Populus alba TaxID=43335 RepID=A0ACC4C2V9_POPAL
MHLCFTAGDGLISVLLNSNDDPPYLPTILASQLISLLREVAVWCCFCTLWYPTDDEFTAGALKSLKQNKTRDLGDLERLGFDNHAIDPSLFLSFCPSTPFLKAESFCIVWLQTMEPESHVQ